MNRNGCGTCRLVLLMAAVLGASVPAAYAGDKTWNNGSADGLWNTTSLNWSGVAWSNAGDAALFGGAGQGTITVPGAINVRSFNVTAGNYTLAGAGGLSIVSTGSGTAAPNSILVNTGSTLTINAPLSSSIGLYKDGAGTLQLGAAVSFPAPGTTPIQGDAVNLQIGQNNGINPIGGAGTVELTAASVLPTNASVAIGNGWLNIGAFNTTLGRLVYMNTMAGGTFGANGNNGVYGSGTLKVSGQILAQYNLGSDGSSNSLAANLDMNGGTQQFMVNTVPTSLGYTGLHVTGVISNGELFKSYTNSQAGGIGLYANNTYTGATTINGSLGGTFTAQAFGNVVAGTNASTSLNVVNGVLTLYGANGSYASASTVNVVAAGTLSLDNNSLTTGTNGPAIAAGNNNNRLKSDAAVTLAGGTMQLLGVSGGASSQTIGSLNMANGFNVLRATATSGGTATWNVTGAWTQGASAVTQFAGTTLGTNSIIKFGNTPNSTGGIIDRAFGSNTAVAETGFVKYDATNGVTLLAAGDYQTAFGSGGNVTISASQGPLGTQTINSLRATATATVTFNSGATLGVTSGQILANTGTLTFDAATPNGILAFGSTPAVLHAVGTITDNSPLTGTAGIIKSGNGTLNINTGASLAGMSGTFTQLGGTTTLNVPYTGNFDLVSGTFNLRSNLTTGGVTMTLGNPLTPSNTVGTSIGLNIQSTSVTTIAPNLVVTNGTNPNLSAFTVTINQQGGNNGIVQEFSGSVTLNSGISILGGGNTTNVVLFSGPISGTGPFRVQNGNVRLTNTSTNYDGQFILGNGGNTTLFNFDGQNASATGTILIGFGTGVVTSTRVRVNAANAIPGGQISMLGGTLELKNSMTLPNNIAIGAGAATTAAIDTPTGVTATLTGALTSTDTFPTLQKVSAGTLILNNAGNNYTGIVSVNAGTLLVNSVLGSSSTNGVTVNATATLGGTGTIARNITVANGGTLAPGASPGNLTIDGNVTLSANSTFSAELNGASPGASYDVLTVNGASRVVNINGSNFIGTSTSTSLLTSDRLFVMVLSDAGSTLNGTFSGIIQDGFTTIAGVSGGTTWGAQVSYTGNSVTQSLTGGNDIVLYNFSAVPEPMTLAMIGAVAATSGLGLAWRRRYGKARSA